MARAPPSKKPGTTVPGLSPAGEGKPYRSERGENKKETRRRR